MQDEQREWAAPAGLPPGRPVELPGRGRTLVREAPGPKGAPALMLLHGLGATGALNWFTSFPSLAARFRVIAMDLRGHGRGIRSGSFSLEDCADDTAVLADELGLDRFVAVGYSMGGPVAQLIWRRHRGRVSGLVLCATARNFRGSASVGLMRRMMPASWAARVAPGGLARMTGIIVSGGADDSALRRWAIRELGRTSPIALLQAVGALGRFSSHEWIGEVDVPTSVVVTMRDQLVPPSRQLKLAHAIPHSHVYPIQGDHFVCGTTPSLFAPVLFEACDALTKRSRSRANASGGSSGGGAPRL
jgi:pimeloyl-ACP methyl ester carboxylesterase